MNNYSKLLRVLRIVMIFGILIHLLIIIYQLQKPTNPSNVEIVKEHLLRFFLIIVAPLVALRLICEVTNRWWLFLIFIFPSPLIFSFLWFTDPIIDFWNFDRSYQVLDYLYVTLCFLYLFSIMLNMVGYINISKIQYLKRSNT